MCVLAQSCLILCDPMDYRTHQAPLSLGLSRQEYWSGLPFPLLGDLPDPGIEPRSSALQVDSLQSATREALVYCSLKQYPVNHLCHSGEKNIAIDSALKCYPKNYQMIIFC